MLPDPVSPASTILVVDDEEFLLEYVRLVLVRAGFSVLTAQKGDEAWHLFLHGHGEIRLVLADIVMPGSFDGFELAERIRRRRPELTILFMTGALPHERPCADALLSNRPLLRKPFYPDQLLAIVRENLEAVSQSARELGL
jgi:DNA-binding response OmpR family regulator